MKKKLTLAVAATVIVGFMALGTPALAETTVTAFAPSTTTTPGVWFENSVRTGGTASIADLTGIGGNLELSQPMQIGAAKITTDFTNPAKAEVGVLNSYGKPSDIFSTLSINYSYHKASNPVQNDNHNLFAAPSLKLTFWDSVCDDPAGDCYGTLTYEPYWNGSNGPGVVTSLAMDTWTTVTIDENTGVFWWSGGFGQPNSFGGGPFNTLAQWLTVFSSDFGDADLVLVSIGVGTYNQGQIGYFDDVQISHVFGASFSESYDFEPPPPAYSCIGFDPPMDKPVRVKKKNRVLPLKMVLLDENDIEVTELISPPLVEVDITPGNPTDPEDENFLPAGQGDDGNQFDCSGGDCQFNLQTKNFSGVGTYTITVESGDPAEYIIDPTCIAVFEIY